MNYPALKSVWERAFLYLVVTTGTKFIDPLLPPSGHRLTVQSD